MPHIGTLVPQRAHMPQYVALLNVAQKPEIARSVRKKHDRDAKCQPVP